MFDQDRVNQAWAAGFFEGEGCFTFSRRHKNRGTLRANLGQKGLNGKQLCERFMSIVGVGTIHARKGLTNKDMYVWSTNRLGDAEKVFNLLSPWLSKRRVDRFQELLEAEKESRK